MAYTVHITLTALLEIEKRSARIRRQAPLGAVRWFERILKAIDSLEDHPERCSLAPENEWYDGELRQLVIGKRKSAYRILFEIRGHMVFILRLRYGAQDIMKPGEI
jgi:plasmid stabilization system protein ParE